MKTEVAESLWILLFLNWRLGYRWALVGHRAIVFSSEIGPSIWEALKKSDDQPEPNNDNGDDKNKDE